jgi:L-arabinose transport system ATP-binding protein
MGTALTADADRGANLLVVEHLSKSFGTVRALSDISLEARPGEILALMGENGAGKSTLLKIMSGSCHADQGEIRLGGRLQTYASPLDARKAGVRVVHQEPDIVTDMSVAENLFIGELPRGPFRLVDRNRLLSDARRLLDTFRFGSGIDPEMRAGALSPAQRQMVEILRALRPGLRVIAFDEPTSSLSEAEAEDLFGVIRKLRDDGLTIIYVSHRMNEILSLADRVAVLRDGAMVGIRPARELDQARLVTMMVGRNLAGDMRRLRNIRSEVLLRVRGLTSPEVADISFDVRAGEVVGLAGLVGAGRSELAQTIFGARKATAGTVEIAGQEPGGDRPRAAIAAGLVYVPEERKADGIFAERPVRENASIAILRRISPFRVVNRTAETRIVGDLVRRMRVKTPDLEQPIGRLSGGNQQKVILARWLATAPKILILDEPTRGIDIGAKADIYDLIDRLAAEGAAILLISSELPELLGLSDRILCLQAGRLTATIPASEATEVAVLHAIMPSHS